MPMDMRTFVLALAMINLGFAVMLWFYIAVSKVRTPSLMLWRWAKLTTGIGMLVIWSRPWVPGVVSENIALSIQMAGFGLELYAYAVFLDRPSWLRPVALFTAMGVVAVNLALEFGPTRHLSLIVTSLMGAAIYGAMGLLMLCSRAGNRLLLACIGSVDILLSVSLLLRAVLGLSGYSLVPMDSTLVNLVIYAAAFVSAIGNGFGFLLLVKLAEEQALVGALANLRELEEEQRQLLSVVSHEFRTPAAMIKASLDSLRFLQDRIDPEVGQRLENIRSAALRLSDLATTLITRDRLVEQALRPQKSQVEMGKLVGDLLLAHPATEAFDIHLPEAPVILGVDPALIRVALYNLIDNAITHHGAAQGKVRIDLEATRTGAEIRVSDRGQGIPDAVKERVFRRHYSSSGEIAKGIGLASVRAIARSHGGDVSVRDNQPNGAVLVMTLLG